MGEKVYLENKIILRIANPDDLPSIFELVDSYDEHVDFDVDKTITKNSLRDIVYHKGIILAEYNGEDIGGMAGYIMPCLFSKDILFSIMFFYVKKHYRHLTRSIIKELEFALLPEKITKIVFGILQNENADKQQRFMKMLGYKRLEVHMVKSITT